MSTVLKLEVNSKVCSKCEISKPVSEFRQNMGRNHDSIANKCESCFSEMRKATWEAKKFEKEKNYIVPEYKTCSVCDIEKSISEFNKSRNHKDGVRPNCRQCSKERNHSVR